MRKKCDCHLKICNTSLFEKSVVSVGIVLYNKAPNRIKKLESFKVFKKVELKSFLLDHSFYTLNEFFLVLIKVNEIARYKPANQL
jgi:hypothetical protein